MPLINGHETREYKVCPKCGWKRFYKFNKPIGEQGNIDDIEPAGWRCSHCKHQVLL